MACLTIAPKKDFLCAHWFNSRDHFRHQRGWFSWHSSLHHVARPFEVLWRA